MVRDTRVCVCVFVLTFCLQRTRKATLTLAILSLFREAKPNILRINKTRNWTFSPVRPTWTICIWRLGSLLCCAFGKTFSAKTSLSVCVYEWLWGCLHQHYRAHQKHFQGLNFLYQKKKKEAREEENRCRCKNSPKRYFRQWTSVEAESSSFNNSIPWTTDGEKKGRRHNARDPIN